MKLPERFIVVDDDRSNNLICEFSLRRFSAVTEIKTFLEPEVALKYVKEFYANENSKTPTILFLDINMPVLSGWDFLEIFEDFSPEIQNQFTIYILTSSIDDRDKSKAQTNKFVKGFLSKPLSTSLVQGLFNEDY